MTTVSRLAAETGHTVRTTADPQTRTGRVAQCSCGWRQMDAGPWESQGLTTAIEVHLRGVLGMGMNQHPDDYLRGLRP